MTERSLNDHDERVETVTDAVIVGTEMIVVWEIETVMTDGADPARIAMFARTVHVHALALATGDEVIGHVVVTGGTGIKTAIGIGIEIVGPI
jgi:hypothetical protein